MDLKARKILVTGGSSGLGKATAKLLAEAGAKVVITGRDGEKLKQVAKEIGAQALQFDVSNYEEIPAKTAQAIKQLGGIDVLVNNAGIGDFALLNDVKIEHFERVFSTNVFGLALLTQEVARHFTEQQNGDIINIASTAATKGFAYGTVYASSKFALRGMTECWRAELRKHNIRVMLVNPSEVPTAFNNPDRVEKELVSNKLTPIEIAHAIKSVLEMDARGFVPELSVWATNP